MRLSLTFSYNQAGPGDRFWSLRRNTGPRVDYTVTVSLWAVYSLALLVAVALRIL